MKMVKKILLGLAASALVLGFAGCKQVDDEKGAISGSGNNYSVDFTQDGTDSYRAYKSTSLRHAGALVKITFEDPAAGNYSKMGVIFDLQKNAEDKEAKDFYIIGLAGTAADNFYVSKFTNVTQLQAENFGTKLTDNPAVEKVIFDKSKTNGVGSITRPAAVEGNVSYYVYYKAFKDAGEDATTGYYEWAVFNYNDTQAEAAKQLMKGEDASITTLSALGGTCLQSGKIEGIALTATKAVPQNQIAVYAKIDAGKTLKGTWTFLDMYKEAEEIEE